MLHYLNRRLGGGLVVSAMLAGRLAIENVEFFVERCAI